MVDRTSGVPVHRQVAADVRDRIAAGEYGPGDRLPSEREMVESYGASRLTIREALNLLRAEGVVVTEQGRGVFVRDWTTIHRLARSRLSRSAREQDRGAFRADAASEGFTPSVAVTVRFEPADERTARQLALTPGDEVTVRERVMCADGEVVQLAVSRLSRALTRGTAIERDDAGPGGSYARLEEAGHRLGHYAEHVGSRMPTPDEVSTLQLGQGIPVLTVTRIAHGRDGTPLEMNDMVLPAHRYQLSYEWAAD
ncbi:GntR family transcriptional regulator [Saccharomonospora iraqiensis]|uniref:GntR family transcriptional regulator n=1 Tax=Saccharomonospora iraqiensis TaxID=52698 RepID=UPI0003F7CC23|nr:GntR family transcriptional regulator [Saccharomonospora iraqiensis]